VKWNRDIGTWSLLESGWVAVRGATPLNADCWSVDAEIGEYGISISVERSLLYASLTFWYEDGARTFYLGEHRMHRKFAFAYFCSCTCQNK
jgi:hypothetical protein